MTFPMPPRMSSRRRRMNARIRISLSSGSRATMERSSSPVNSRNSPGSVTRPRTRQSCPEIMVISPVNSPGTCAAIVRSPSMAGCTISMAPESRTKKGTSLSLGSKRISPRSTFRKREDGRIRSICAAVRTGKAWVRASRALGMGSVDMDSFSHWARGDVRAQVMQDDGPFVVVELQVALANRPQLALAPCRPHNSVGPVTSADQQVPQLVHHGAAEHPIVIRDRITSRELLNRAVIHIRHVTGAAVIQEGAPHGLERGGASLLDLSADPHPNDKIRTHSRILRIQFRAAACPVDLDSHGLKHIGRLGLGMFDG